MAGKVYLHTHRETLNKLSPNRLGRKAGLLYKCFTIPTDSRRDGSMKKNCQYWRQPQPFTVHDLAKMTLLIFNPSNIWADYLFMWIEKGPAKRSKQSAEDYFPLSYP